MPIFLDDRDYRQFFQLLRQVVEAFDIRCWNYCLMPTHYHLTLQPRLPNISSAMHRLNGRYAQWWNRRHMKVGHVFQGPFKTQIVQRDGYALALARYVALNPVRARLVKRPEDWQWSSYPAIIGARPVSSFLDVDATLALFGNEDRATLQQRFAAFVLSRCSSDDTDDRIRSSDQVLGDVTFRRVFESNVSPTPATLPAVPATPVLVHDAPA